MASQTVRRRSERAPFAPVLMGLVCCLAPAPASAQVRDSVPDSVASGRRALPTVIAFTSGFYAASLFVLGESWYKDRKRVPFHFYNDNRAYLQVDKVGHAFGAYVYSYAAYHALLNAGYSRMQALTFGATAGAILQTPVEIMDGFHE